MLKHLDTLRDLDKYRVEIDTYEHELNDKKIKNSKRLEVKIIFFIKIDFTTN